MYPYIHIILPSYTVMALLGGFTALCLMYLRIEKNTIEFTTFLSLFFFSVLGAIVGSKIVFAVTQIPWLIENFSLTNLIMLIPQSGFVFYGGLFGTIFTLLFMTRRDAILRKKVFNVAVPAMPLFHAFGRVGCFLTGCCYGKELSNSIIFGSIELRRIPVQLIEALAEVILFIIILIIDKKRKDANLLKIYLVSYAIIRFIDEFIRGDKIRGIFCGLSTAQWISLMILVFYGIQKIKGKKNVIGSI